MAGKTEGVRRLVYDVLKTLPKPYGEDITEDVFVAIEGDEKWLQRYEQLCAVLDTGVVNQSIGKYTKEITGLEADGVVAARRTSLTTRYTKLVRR